jgi:hypothetical protein
MPSSPIMKPPARSRHSGRPPKRKRTDAELNDLARVLGADWTQGDTVQTWIHKHEGKTGELSRLVEDGWLWEDIGRAMHLAGIAYSTGQPIPPHTLRLKAYLSRNRERERTAADATSQGRPHALPPVPPASVAASSIEAPARAVAASARTEPPVDASDEGGESAPEEPTFRLVTLKGGNQPPGPQPSPKNPRREISTPTKVSDDEILRRVFGKP